MFKILDLSAGNRAVWFNKNHPLAIYLDKRESVKPTIVCDTRALPSAVGCGYDLVVFDPPHTNCGPNSDMSKSYGHYTTAEILEIVAGSGKEAHRVSKDGALMAFKWSDHSIALSRALDKMPNWEPLFGHSVKSTGGTKHRKGGNQTYWVMLRRLGCPLP